MVIRHKEKWRVLNLLMGITPVILLVAIYFTFNSVIYNISILNNSFSIIQSLYSFLKYLTYLFLILFVVILLLVKFFKFNFFINRYLLDKESFLHWRFIKEIEFNKSVFKFIELDNRLKLFKIKFNRKILGLSFLLISISFFSFVSKKYVNPINTSVYDIYLRQFNFNFGKEFYLEGDSLILNTDNISSDVYVSYNGISKELNNKSIFLGFVEGTKNFITINVNSYKKPIFFNLINKPKIIHSTVEVNYNNLYIKKFINEFNVEALLNSNIRIDINFENASERDKIIDFKLSSDTVIMVYFFNENIIDSVQFTFKTFEPTSPKIDFEKTNDGYKIYITDSYGLKKLDINGYTKKINGLNYNFILGENSIYKITVENILNVKSVVLLNNKLVYDNSKNSIITSTEYNDFTETSNQSLNENIKNLIETLDILFESKWIDEKDYTEIKEYLIEEYKKYVSLRKGEDLRKVQENIFELSKILKEIANNQLDDKKKENEIKKLKNKLNSFKKKSLGENLNPVDNTEDALSTTDIVNLENFLVNLNLVSLDIDKGFYKSPLQLFRLSSLTFIVDSLNALIDKNKKLKEILSEDLFSIKQMVFSKKENLDLKEVRFRINNLTVKIYNILKNRELINMGSSENNKNSNCNNNNNGNTKKPGISELLSEIINDGESEEGKNGSEDKDHDGKSKESDKEKTQEGDDNEKNIEKKGKGKVGNSDSLEELEKQLLNKIGNYEKNDSLFKQKIKWLDYSNALRVNPLMDSKRKGNYVMEQETIFNKNTGSKQIENFMPIRKQNLHLKTNVYY